MSASSRRPPIDRGAGEAPVEPGYLLGERLPEDDAAAIAATSAAAAVIVGLIIRSPEIGAPEPAVPPATSEQAPRPEPAPPSAGTAEPPRAPSVPALPAPIVEEARRTPKREAREEPRPIAMAVESATPAPATRETPGTGLATAVAPPTSTESVVQMMVRRTDDPRRAPILMTIRYRRPVGASKEILR